jgi:hypothetical protein
MIMEEEEEAKISLLHSLEEYFKLRKPYIRGIELET